MSTSNPASSLHLVPEHESKRGNDEGDNWEEYFSLGRLLGSGGYAQVFLARRHTNAAEVALKVLEAASAKDRFRREIDEQRRAHHPNVMPIHEFGAGWYAMPLAVGTLKDLAPELSDDARMRMVQEVAAGLAHAHRLGLVHRDVSPNNVMLLRDDGDRDRWVIADFGLVRRPPGQTSGSTTMGPAGTTGFVAPEVVIMGAHRADRRADIYSLGRVVAYAVTGYWPRAEDPVPNIPAEWAPLVELMTHRVMDERLASLDQIADQLSAVEARLRAVRRQRWGDARQAGEGPTRLSPAEITALAVILDSGYETFTKYQLLRESKGVRQRELALGFMALQHRGFLEQVSGEEGPESALTDVAREWAIQNESQLLSEGQLGSAKGEAKQDNDVDPF